MTILLGFDGFPLKLQKELKEKSNDTFDTLVQVNINDLPKIKGWKPRIETATGIKLTGFVEPHTDPYTGCGAYKDYRSLFWLLSDTTKDKSFLMVGNESERMLPYNWAFFDDSVLHSFMSNGTWIGLAIQYIR